MIALDPHELEAAFCRAAFGRGLAIVCQIAEARRYLKATHRSYRSTAAELGVTYQHVSNVLNERTTSAPLLRRILALPKHRPVHL